MYTIINDNNPLQYEIHDKINAEHCPHVVALELVLKNR